MRKISFDYTGFLTVVNRVIRRSNLSMAEVAEKCGVGVSALYNKLNPNLPKWKLNLGELLVICDVTRNCEALRFINRALGLFTLSPDGEENESDAVA